MPELQIFSNKKNQKKI